MRPVEFSQLTLRTHLLRLLLFNWMAQNMNSYFPMSCVNIFRICIHNGHAERVTCGCYRCFQLKFAETYLGMYRRYPFLEKNDYDCRYVCVAVRLGLRGICGNTKHDSQYLIRPLHPVCVAETHSNSHVVPLLTVSVPTYNIRHTRHTNIVG